MKIKSVVCVNLGLYMDIRSEIEIEVPDGLKDEELVKHLYKRFHGLLTPEKLAKVDTKKGRDIAEYEVEEA